jgi:hypothetical protein
MAGTAQKLGLYLSPEAQSQMIAGRRVKKMTNLPCDPHTPTLQQNATGIQARNYSAGRAMAQFAAVVLVLLIYSYPALRARTDFGAASLPPIFAPDLSLYLNLSNVRTVGPGQVLNPYYLVPVPANGTAYLKFRLGPSLFRGWNKLMAGRMWLAMFLWNLFWWGLLCGVALWLFERFLPIGSREVGIAGLGLLMLVNIGMAKPLLTAWVHLPSLAGFQSVALQLPFMRAFAPQIPMPLLLGYLGLQIGALRAKGVYRWVAMGVLQLAALSAFPYATLMMAGLTLVSVLWWIFSRGLRGVWHTPLAYGAACAIADGVFLMRGSLNVYASHSSPIHFQPQLLPHLVGGAWLLLCLLTVATVLSKALPAEVKWPLAGLGATNVVLMLGDAVVPSAVLLLSHHASYFAHTTAAVLLTFLASGALVRMHNQSNKIRVASGVALGLLALNGILLSLGTYRTFLPLNRQQVEVTRLLSSWQPAEAELFIARSRFADDACGWVALLSRGPVLFCTDAEVLLTPPQNRDLHRFRQALYLYFTGKDSGYLQGVIHDSNPAGPMYQLGFWAEATSLSPDEQKEGLRSVQADLMPVLERVERHDAAVSSFFHQFRRIIVIDDQQDPAFLPARLASFLKLEGDQRLDNWVLLSYVPE